MQVTLYDIPIVIEDRDVQEIVRRFFTDTDHQEWREKFEAWKRGEGPKPAHTALVGINLVGTSQVELKPGETLIGSYAGPDGKITVAILLPGEKSGINFVSALAWASGLLPLDEGGNFVSDLPNRVEALLLFQHHRGEFQSEVYWTNEQRAEDSSCAWGQSFDYGDQSYWHQDLKSMARAVRRVTI